MRQHNLRPSFIVFMTIIVFLSLILGYVIYTTFIDVSPHETSAIYNEISAYVVHNEQSLS